MAEIPYLLRLTHAMCYYTAQGRTVRDKHVLLIDTNHPNVSHPALIVGLPRTTPGNMVHMATNETEILGREWSVK